MIAVIVVTMEKMNSDAAIFNLLAVGQGFFFFARTLTEAFSVPHQNQHHHPTPASSATLALEVSIC